MMCARKEGEKMSPSDGACEISLLVRLLLLCYCRLYMDMCMCLL